MNDQFEVPIRATTPADLADFYEFALEKVTNGDSASIVQFAIRWTEERELQGFIRCTMESNEQFEQGLGRPLEELSTAMRAKIDAVRALLESADGLRLRG
jgi:hypothetical protein